MDRGWGPTLPDTQLPGTMLLTQTNPRQWAPACEVRGEKPPGPALKDPPGVQELAVESRGSKTLCKSLLTRGEQETVWSAKNMPSEKCTSQDDAESPELQPLPLACAPCLNTV